MARRKIDMPTPRKRRFGSFWRGHDLYDFGSPRVIGRSRCPMPSTAAYSIAWTRFPLCFYDTAQFGGALNVLIHALEHLRLWPWVSERGMSRGYIWADYDGGPMYFRWPAGGDLRKAKHLQREVA